MSTERRDDYSIIWATYINIKYMYCTIEKYRNIQLYTENTAINVYVCVWAYYYNASIMLALLLFITSVRHADPKGRIHYQHIYTTTYTHTHIYIHTYTDILFIWTLKKLLIDIHITLEIVCTYISCMIVYVCIFLQGNQKGHWNSNVYKETRKSEKEMRYLIEKSNTTYKILCTQVYV